MNSSALTQFLIDVTRGHKADSYVKDPETVLKTSGLANELRTAIEKQDIGALWLAGAHPMALLYFARACGWTSERYYACISDAGASANQSSKS
jgi:Aromatic-ring-opening dioxygenase LigAB, LigA subunit